MINDFYRLKIAALEDANLELREKEIELTGYIFDLLQKDTPEDYKRVIKNQVFND